MPDLKERNKTLYYNKFWLLSHLLALLSRHFLKLKRVNRKAQEEPQAEFAANP